MTNSVNRVGLFNILHYNGKVYIAKTAIFNPNVEHGLDRNEVKELITVLSSYLDDQVDEVFPGLKNLPDI